jgi:formylglycine-generating enzyme required for sulfatase activity
MAQDMADDLRHFLSEQTANQSFGSASRHSASSSVTPVTPAPSTQVGKSQSLDTSATTLTSDRQQVKIVPKGLRSFDAHDADFFLELLPGPRDRDGLPDSIRFWKTRIEETDPDKTFTVGLICGPSGCGKSSLVKAGLLPRLSEDVIPIYVEATAEETETRLLNGLRKRCSALSANLSPKEALMVLRQGQGIPVGKKALIVLDQFEQWLHARKEEGNTDLVQALRQCDGGRVQCIVMVRDDFWMAVIRFMRELEVRLADGQNSAAVDLFDLHHARKVLAAFGRAFGKLSEKTSDVEKEQKEFLKLAVSGLARDGKVISVRLALFAEMMKSKMWTPASLKAVGGTEGVGVTFLEETFSATTAPPEHRYHQKAARGVLKALLPEAGADIKGHMRSQQELLNASGYASRTKDFDDLVRILDSEIRLITPTDPEGAENATLSQTGAKYYQLTHDYLVHSLRDWLTRKQKETRRGRAELLLADRAAVWNVRPENRQLPSLLQYLQIRWHTRGKSWTPPQRKVMHKAERYHAIRAFLVAVVLAFICWGVYEGHGTLKAHALQDRLFDANINEVPTIVQDMVPYRRWLDPLLHDAYAQAESNYDRRKQLYSSLALLPVDASQVVYLKGRLLSAEPGEVAVISDALFPFKDQLIGELWPLVESPAKSKELQRLRAAAALAKYDSESEKWAKAAVRVVNDLVRENSVYLLYWSEAFRPVKGSFLGPLRDVFRDQRPEQSAESSLATDLLADYAADDPQLLAELVMDADEKQFAVIFPPFKGHGEKGLALLTEEIDKKLPADLPSASEKREKLAMRQANAAVVLLRMNQTEKVWPLLKRTPPDDPRVRSYLIHRLGPLGADGGAIIKHLNEEPDVTIRRALFSSLGEFSEEQLPAETRTSLLPKLNEIYGKETDPGLHAAVEWLLRQWKQEDWLKRENEERAKDRNRRAQRLESIQQLVQKHGKKTPPQWYVNAQGQTMVVIPGPVEFLMGSPPTEEGYMPHEIQHKRQISRTFAVAAKPVTVSEFWRFVKENKLEKWFEAGGEVEPLMKRYSRAENGPIILVDWYTAAAYCNWLSQQDGIREDQWCYDTNAWALPREKVSVFVSLLLPHDPLTGATSTSYFLLDRQPQVTALKKNYLGLHGYRLPTEAEMEYTCSAGAVTSRYFGETDELLVQYGWYQKNSKERTWSVGAKKPNDLGLFDMHGNVWNWCQETYEDYPAKKGGVIEDKEGVLNIVPTSSRVLRGGSVVDRHVDLRSAARNRTVPDTRSSVVGFRPARTLAP